jgi:hypothetical protein
MKWGRNSVGKLGKQLPPKNFSDTDVFEALREMFFLFVVVFMSQFK